MLSKLGLPAMLVACLLLFAAPALAQDATEPTTVPTTVDPASTTPTSSIVAQLETGSIGVDGPATVSGQTPTRGTQIQLSTPPPPPASVFDPPADTGNGRRVVYSKSKQTVWAYDENNTIIKMHRVSGRQTPNDPAPGTYKVWSRSIRTYSINNPTITWGYMVRFATGARGGNIGFHEIPYQYGQPVQTVDELGEALSGGCVRQTTEDAIWMWNWAQLGTVVVVTP
ncbi:MAG TPA: L,D-transpeptidase [Ilumatobacteraceae bacterium]|nr:L,D-transpeptidase [Ilumatobacteraceae bacterium]